MYRKTLLVSIFILSGILTFPIDVWGQDTNNPLLKPIEKDTSSITKPEAERDSSLIVRDTTVDTQEAPKEVKEKKGLVKIFFPGPRPPFDPEIAWKRSLIFPGFGQIYNKSYWKLPIVYGGYVGFALWIDFNNKNYVQFRTAYRQRTDDDPDNDFLLYPSQVPNDGLRNARDRARRSRDYAVLFLVGYHVLQVVEAFVDAHLKNFDVSEDLTLKTYPSTIQHQLAGGQQFTYPGITLSLGFK